ncbi:MalY/PatB family protein [Uliginosibacterium sp. sgz301328]|uniref:MalY/PatB family protein n=1 Tax=Uliginosibacterium sp. sgz301328 TaxID=3243764 RepID=UPI00359EDEE3
MEFDFDTPIQRGASDSLKWGRYAGRDVLPLWVADMDFASPPAVIAALHKRVEHGVFGYAEPWPSLIDAVVEGIARDHGWRIDADWLVWLPGIVTGFNVACSVAGEPGDEVFTFTPVYPPFLSAPRHTGRRLVRSDMRREDGRWTFDWDDVSQKITERTRMLLLCSPHNPIGRVYDHQEVFRLAAIAEQHDLLICSDEIHAGLVLDPLRPHIPIAALDDAVARRTITLMAPSKTWNVPGLFCGFAIIPDPTLRRRYVAAMQGIVPHANVLGLVAAEAAYRDGDSWRQALLQYLAGNARAVEAAVAGMPGLSMTPVEATYLAWIDCRQAGLERPAAHFEAHGVGLSDGADFGMPGFVRLNFGCPRSTLDEALRRMRAALPAG